MRVCRTLAIATLAGLPACTTGFVYTDIVVPLDVNAVATLVQDEVADRDHDALSFNVVRIDWGSEAIGDAARRHGIDVIESADLEVFSVLGIWNRRTVIVYGRARDGASTTR